MALRCVTHVDLKGAPPNVDYLARHCIPFMKKYGSWGVLLEWEDTFPFTSDLIGIGSLGGCSRDGMYTHDDVKYILQAIKKNGMVPIQLIQTIGHMEFVLKHGQYRRLREVPHSPAVLCPSRPESRALVENMISQVLSVQPDAPYIHIGADEVWHLNVCADCQARSSALQCEALALYLEHIKAICILIKAKCPNIQILMWDDMLRNISAEVMKEYNLDRLVQPVVWNYNTKEHFNIDKYMWERYSFVFSNVWTASAFKGANGSSQMSCSVQRYASNQFAWRDEIAIYEGEIRFAGIILTGWSRYDHYATLCELLPIALPSLAVCLQIWTSPDVFTNESVTYTEPLQSADWPGFDLAQCVITFATLRDRVLQFVDGDAVTTWLNQWQIEHDYTNPLHVERIADGAEQLQSDLKLIREPLSTSLHALTGRRSAEEFLQTFLAPLETRVAELRARADARKGVEAGVTPKSDKQRRLCD